MESKLPKDEKDIFFILKGYRFEPVDPREILTGRWRRVGESGIVTNYYPSDHAIAVPASRVEYWAYHIDKLYLTYSDIMRNNL